MGDIMPTSFLLIPLDLLFPICPVLSLSYLYLLTILGNLL